MRVEVFEYIGIPMYFHVGSPREGVKMGSKLHDKRSAVSLPLYAAFRGSDYDINNSEWYAEILAYVRIVGIEEPSCSPKWSKEILCFVRWLEEDKSDPEHPVVSILEMKLLKGKKISSRNEEGRSRLVGRIELVYAHDLIRPVYVQPLPKIAGRRRNARVILNTHVPFCL